MARLLRRGKLPVVGGKKKGTAERRRRVARLPRRGKKRATPARRSKRRGPAPRRAKKRKAPSRRRPAPPMVYPGDDFPLAPYWRSLPHLHDKTNQKAWKVLRRGHYQRAFALLEKKARQLRKKKRKKQAQKGKKKKGLGKQTKKGRENKKQALQKKRAQQKKKREEKAAEALLVLGQQAQWLGDHKRALRLYREVMGSLASRGTRLKGRVLAARLLYLRQQPREALRLLVGVPLRPPRGGLLRRYWIAAHLLRARLEEKFAHRANAIALYVRLMRAKARVADYARYRRLVQLSLYKKYKRNRRYRAVLRGARALRRHHPRSRYVRHARMLIARNLERLKKYKAALRAYQRLLRRGGKGVVHRYERLPREGPVSTGAILLGIYRCYLHLGKRRAARLTLRRLLRGQPGGWSAGEAGRTLRRLVGKKWTLKERYLYAYHLYRRRRCSKAITQFQQLAKLLRAATRSPTKKGRKKGAKKAPTPKGKKKPSPRGVIPRKGKEGKKDEKAKKGAKKGSKEGGKGAKRKIPKRWARWLALGAYYQGVCLFRLKKNKAARRSFALFLKNFPRHKLRYRARIYWIRSNYRAERNLAAVRQYASFYRKYPKYSRSRRMLWWAAILTKEHGEDVPASRLFRLYARRYRRSRKRGHALVQVGLIRYRRQKYKKAIRALRPATKLSPAVAARAWFWIGKSYEKLKKKKKAHAAFRRIRSWSDAYYYARARERLGGPPFLARRPLPLYRLLPTEKEEGRSQKAMNFWLVRRLKKKGGLAASARLIQKDDGYRRAWLFALAGRRRLATSFLRRLRARLRQKPGALYLLGRAFQAFGIYHEGLRTSYRVHRGLSRKVRRKLPRQPLLRLQFPLPFAYLYSTLGKQYHVRPLLMLALTRQESLFDPFCVSGAGARGIAQIMPFDGKRIAKKWRLPDYKTSHLYRPDVNLRMGFYHFAEGLKRYKQNVELSLAAYNAGNRPLQRWLASKVGRLLQDDLEAFVEEAIGYRETRHYVRLVLRWYNLYRLRFASRR